jgi:hypothetical protein
VDLYVTFLPLLGIRNTSLTRSDIDTKVAQVVSLRFGKESFWQRGNFPATITNDSAVVKLTNPWIQSPVNVAPFDQGESAIPHSF